MVARLDDARSAVADGAITGLVIISVRGGVISRLDGYSVHLDRAGLAEPEAFWVLGLASRLLTTEVDE
jgi:hypothetical protein